MPAYLAFQLLSLAAPKTRARLASHSAGQAWEGPGQPAEPLWEVKRYRNAKGELLVGTAAAPLLAGALPPPRPFSPQALEQLDLARAQGPARPLASWVGFLALLLLLGTWWLG